jgi:hypothetical protein
MANRRELPANVSVSATINPSGRFCTRSRALWLIRARCRPDDLPRRRILPEGWGGRSPPPPSTSWTGGARLRLSADLHKGQPALGACLAPVSAEWRPAWIGAKAITATAHKLARLVHTMFTKSEECVDKGQDYYEERDPDRVIHRGHEKLASRRSIANR